MDFVHACFYIIIGKTELLEEEMKSILAQYEYKSTIKEFEEQGVPFCTYMYVPEVYPGTGEIFYEREDDAHLLKVGVSYQLHAYYISL